MKFVIGDRVRRTGPHLANGGQNYGNKECQVGSVGTVNQVYAGREVSVGWDHGRNSRIVASSLEHEHTFEEARRRQEEHELDQEFLKLLRVEPCKTCGCKANGNH